MFAEWPLGQLPEELQRSELKLLAQAGYTWENPHDIIHMFEDKAAEFAGCKYAVAVDSCSNALFLSMKYLECKGTITIPSRTYISVPMQIIHAGCNVAFKDEQWEGQYQLKPYDIWDAAPYWSKGMHEGIGEKGLQCVSFQIKKSLPIGKGGMILTNDHDAATWLRVASHDGRGGGSYADMQFKILGWHCNMTPEDAARGILLMDSPHKMKGPVATEQNYTDISAVELFKPR